MATPPAAALLLSETFMSSPSCRNGALMMLR